MSFNPDIDTMYEGIRSGDKVLMARAITLIESNRPDLQSKKIALLDKCHAAAGKAIRLGITGPPGAGKSTLIAALGKVILDAGHNLAVLAVDPSSDESKGSILGDKTRMESLIHPDVFIRPSPNNLELGGVRSNTRESMLICDAAGFDYIILETVGVGQSEVEAAGMVDLLILLLTPAGGDELQGIKKGIMEAADIILINKADQSLKDEAFKAKWFIQQSFRQKMSKEAEIPLLIISALENKNIDKVFQLINTKYEALKNSGELELKRKKQDESWLESGIRYAMLQKLNSDDHFIKNLKTMINNYNSTERSVPAVINEFVANWKLISE